LERIVVIGNAGSGKSTLAKELAERYHLPLLHLDTVFWLPGWVKAPQEAMEEAHRVWLAKPQWIIDGNYRRQLDERLALADTVFYLKLPTIVSLWSAVLRSIRFQKQSRPDITIGCEEKFDAEFFRWIVRFRKDVEPHLEAALARHPHLRVEMFRSRAELRRRMKQFDSKP
jgi:adenylate kinase family enzyme